MKPPRARVAVDFILAALLVLPGVSMAAMPEKRCPEPRLPADFNPASIESVQAAVKGGPRILFALGKGRRMQLLKLLEEGENPNVCVLGSSLLTFSVMAGDTEQTALLLAHGTLADDPRDSDGGTPLLSALETGHLDAAELLLAAGADATAHTDGGTSALHSLARDPAPAEPAAAQKRLDIARNLLKRGALVDARISTPGTTPLMIAAIHGDLKLAALLLDKNADPSLRDAHGMSALDIARKKGNVDMIQLLERRSVATRQVK